MTISKLLQICWLYIHDVTLPFLRIPKVLYRIESWRSFEYSELTVRLL